MARVESCAHASRRDARALILWVGFGLLSGCALDSRRLRPAPDSGAVSGGFSGVDSSVAGGASGGALGGHAGSVSGTGGVPQTPDSPDASAGKRDAGVIAAIPSAQGCADLDENGVGDCKETLAKNPDFATDVSDWTAEPDTVLSWDAGDARGDSASGSALVSSTGALDANGSVLRAASQCVPIQGATLVTAYANAFIDADQDPGGQAALYVFFFDAPECAGSSSTSFSTPAPLDAVPGAWFTLRAGLLTAASTKSALLKLAISKPFRAASFHARFDNVLVKTQAQ